MLFSFAVKLLQRTLIIALVSFFLDIFCDVSYCSDLDDSGDEKQEERRKRVYCKLPGIMFFGAVFLYKYGIIMYHDGNLTPELGGAIVLLSLISTVLNATGITDTVVEYLLGDSDVPSEENNTSNLKKKD